MTIVSPMGQLRPVFADKNGKRLSGGKVYTYEPGTLTPKATYTDALNLIPNTNPISLNESGEADIYLDGGYRMQVFDRYGALIQDVDNFRTWAGGIPAESIFYGSQDLKQFNTGVEAAIENRYTKAETYSKPEIDTSLTAVAGGHKAYQTLAAAQAAQATLPANSIVEVTNDGANNGTYQWNGTTLTKSAYDPKNQAISESKLYTDEQISDLPIDGSGDVSNLFEFEDKNKNVAVAIRENGDIVNSDFSLNTVGLTTNKALQNTIDNNVIASNALNKTIEHQPSIDLVNETISLSSLPSLHDFSDEKGRVVASVLKNGDIIFNGGESLIDKTRFYPSRKISLKNKEFMTSDFLALFNQRNAFNGMSVNAPVFIGATKQNFTISNVDDFLNLRVTQGAEITIDTPYLDGKSTTAPYSQVVHPYICEFKDKPLGYRYILLATPFHNVSERLENPCVWGSHDLNSFDLLTKEPLAKPLETGVRNYNSDNFGVYDHTTGEFCCFYRNTDGESNDKNHLYVRKTIDFKTWSNAIQLTDVSGVALDSLLLSPSIIFNPLSNKWVMYAVDQTDGYHYRTSDYLESGWSGKTRITTPAYINPWHQETRYCGSHFICIINDLYSSSASKQGVSNLFIGISDDGINWQFSPSIFTGQFDAPYKASISPFLENNLLKFHVVWSSNGNTGVNNNGFKLYHSITNGIGVN